MKLEYAATLGAILLIWNRIKKIYNDLAKIAEPVIREVEKRSQDGKINQEDRKQIVMVGINEAEKEGKIKLNFITRRILSIIVDKIAAKLPDFNISKGVIEIVDKAQNNVVVK